MATETPEGADSTAGANTSDRPRQISSGRVVILPVLIDRLNRIGLLSNPDKYSEFLIEHYSDIKNALEKLDKLERAVDVVWARGEWEHAHDCGELGPNTTTRACTCGLNNFKRAMFWNED